MNSLKQNLQHLLVLFTPASRSTFVSSPLRWCVLGAAAFSNMSGRIAIDDPVMEVSLPTMIVTALSDDQPWQYAQVDGCEVLTMCDEVRTTKVIAAITRSRLFVPEDFQSTGTRDIRCVIFDQFVGQGSPHPAGTKPLSHNEFGEGWYRMTNVVNEPSGIISANLHGIGVGEWPELWMSSLELYFDNVQPRSPAWIREGLLGKNGALMRLGGYEKSSRLTRLAAFAWNDIKIVQDYLKNVQDGHGLYPLADLFESPPPVETEMRNRWELQAALFCRWQIYSPEGQRNGGHGFWNWARLARNGPVDEKMFKECIGFDYATSERRLLRYLDRVLGLPQDVPIRIYPLTEKFELRDATDQEIAMLLGEFQWQEAKRLRGEGDWEQALNYESAARRTYARGLTRTKGDARLHAGLGLLEYEGGCPDEARAHLEKAFTGKGSDGRALLALSRLRFEEAKGLADAEGKLNSEQIVHVLTPSIMTRELPPVAVEVYRLIGEVWTLSAITPEARYLNVLLEGVANYPHDLDLAHQVAELHARFGHHEIARAVAQRAARLAGRSKYRERFDALLAGVGQP